MRDLSPDAFRRAMLAYARSSPSYRRLVAETLGEIRGILEEHGDAVYVSYSGGKDSTVLLHLAARVRPDVTVFHWDHGPWLMPREVEDEILSNMRRIAPRARFIVLTGRRLRDPRARWDYTLWYRAFHGALERLARERGLRVALIGLRWGEGSRRSNLASRLCRRGSHGLECYPIRGWGWRDVWAYIFEHRLPYPRTYDIYCPLLGWDRCRLVTFFDEEFRHLGANIDGVLLWWHKHPYTVTHTAAGDERGWEDE